MDDEIKFKFVGDGSTFIDGVPGRDLTAADVAALPAIQRAAVKRSSLYEAVAPPKTAAKTTRRRRAAEETEVAADVAADETSDEPAAAGFAWVAQEGE